MRVLHDEGRTLRIERAEPAGAAPVAVMVGELLDEIMRAVGVPAFNFDLADTTQRLRDYLTREHYFVFVAHHAEIPVGFVTLYESHALYAEGDFGTIAEFYVRPAYRSRGIGHQLLARVRRFATARDWKRLEVTTPPLPTFDQTLAFYQREGFEITGGRKLKTLL